MESQVELKGDVVIKKPKEKGAPLDTLSFVERVKLKHQQALLKKTQKKRVRPAISSVEYGEEEVGGLRVGHELSDLVAKRAAADNAKAVVISAKIDSELAVLDAEELLAIGERL